MKNIRKNIFKDNAYSGNWFNPEDFSLEIGRIDKILNFSAEVQQWLNHDLRRIKIYKNKADFWLIGKKHDGSEGFVFLSSIKFHKTGSWHVGKRKAFKDPRVIALGIIMGYLKHPKIWHQIARLSERISIEAKGWNLPILKGSPNALEQKMRTIALKSFANGKYVLRIVFYDDLRGKQYIPFDYMTPDVLKFFKELQESES